MAYVMAHTTDPKTDLLKEIGDISNVEVFNNQVLVAIYIRPEQTLGGIILTNNIREEDKWQGKIGLVLKKGPSAFVDDSKNWFNGVDVEVNDWVVFRPSDGWGLTVNGNMCRLLDDTVIRGRVTHPDTIF
jgi:co-chaperonin GroES (HSP10)